MPSNALCIPALPVSLLVCVLLTQLYALDKRYLDPRRPVAAKSTPQQAEEGLLPYSELIIYNTLMYPTQDKQVGGVVVGRLWAHEWQQHTHCSLHG